MKMPSTASAKAQSELCASSLPTTLPTLSSPDHREAGLPASSASSVLTIFSLVFAGLRMVMKSLRVRVVECVFLNHFLETQAARARRAHPPRSPAVSSRASARSPPRKSMPKFFWPRMREADDRDGDHRERNADPEPALAMKSICFAGLIRCSIVIRLIQPASMRPAEDRARDDHRREHRGDDADRQRHREALDRPGGFPEEDRGGDQRRRVRVEDDGERLVVGGVDRRRPAVCRRPFPRAAARRSARLHPRPGRWSG